MSQDTAWTDGYRAALADVETVMRNRELMIAPVAALLADLQQDALVIEHANKAALQRRRLHAAQEEPLFEASR